MIKSFKHRGLKRLYERGDPSRIGTEHVERIEDILAHLDTARPARGSRSAGIPAAPPHRKPKGVLERDHFWKPAIDISHG
jgi:hypothetical protein